MAAKGGGAWKVAYADFVTAMMAFFLVMWICSQDQKFRQAVARYFNNPMGIDSFGTSRKPDRTGSMFDGPSHGDLPHGESVLTGQGRRGHTDPGEPSPATKMVSDWLVQDKKAAEYWKERAKPYREAGEPRRDAKGKDNSKDLFDQSARQLARQLRDEVQKGMPPEAKGIYQDMLFRAMSEVNWLQLAEDLMLHD